MSKSRVEFKIVMLEASHKYNLYAIAIEFKIVMLEASHKYNLYAIAIEFKIVMLAKYHKFHIKLMFYHQWLQVNLHFHIQFLVYL
jgi:hypothetical protein